MNLDIDDDIHLLLASLVPMNLHQRVENWLISNSMDLSTSCHNKIKEKPTLKTLSDSLKKSAFKKLKSDYEDSFSKEEFFRPNCTQNEFSQLNYFENSSEKELQDDQIIERGCSAENYDLTQNLSTCTSSIVGKTNNMRSYPSSSNGSVKTNEKRRKRKKIEPKYIKGWLAMCPYCQMSSSDFNKCMRCKKELPADVESMKIGTPTPSIVSRAQQ
ncbi:hypothetical protein TKK_0009455 [Trichogramma kaykai]